MFGWVFFRMHSAAAIARTHRGASPGIAAGLGGVPGRPLPRRASRTALGLGLDDAERTWRFDARPASLRTASVAAVFAIGVASIYSSHRLRLLPLLMRLLAVFPAVVAALLLGGAPAALDW